MKSDSFWRVFKTKTGRAAALAIIGAIGELVFRGENPSTAIQVIVTSVLFLMNRHTAIKAEILLKGK